MMSRQQSLIKRKDLILKKIHRFVEHAYSGACMISQQSLKRKDLILKEINRFVE